MKDYQPPSLNNGTMPPHNPGLSLVRATEAAALAAGRWMGLDERNNADHEAQDAMADCLDRLPMCGRIISGEEGRIGGHSRLDSESLVGTGNGPKLDVEVNAIDGASLVADGKPGALSVAAFAPAGSMWHPSPAVYMERLVVDRSVGAALPVEALDAPPAWTLALVARQKGKDIRDLVVFILDRPRHRNLITEVRRAGARVFLREGGDVGGALLAADPRGGIDILMGTGGAAEGLITACAVKALGGTMIGRVSPQTQIETQACMDAGLDTSRILSCDDMVQGEEIFFSATGITDCVMIDGVQYHGDTVETHTLFLRHETGTRRIIRTEHRIR